MADNALPILAKSLRRGEGMPNIPARRSILDDLVDNALSRAEIRYLRARLNAISMNKDILMDLPHELLLCIIPYIDLDDFLRARQVSRVWMERLSSPDISLILIKKHFRGTWETSFNAVGSAGQVSSKISPSKWLSEAAVKRLRRQQCNFRTWHYFNYGVERQYEADNYAYGPEDALYNNGRIAFRVNNRTIAVQTLPQVDMPRLFVDPDREPIQMWLISEQYLIAPKSSNKYMIEAWDLELSSAQNVQSVRLPSRIREISAYKNKVGLVTHSNEAMVWHIGGGLRHLDITGIQEKMDGFDSWEISSVLFHPSSQDTIFIVSQAYKSSEASNSNLIYNIRLIIQELVGGRQKSILHVDIVFKTAARSLMKSSRVVVDRDGLCGIWHTAWISGLAEHIGIRFDMFRKEFDTRPLKCNYPLCLARTIHGQACDISAEEVGIWADSKLSESSLAPHAIEGDDDYVVIFGHSHYLVLVP